MYLINCNSFLKREYSIFVHYSFDVWDIKSASFNCNAYLVVFSSGMNKNKTNLIGINNNVNVYRLGSGSRENKSEIDVIIIIP